MARNFFSTVFLLICGQLLICSDELFAKKAPVAIVVTDLSTEYEENPIGLDKAQPLLSWKLQADGHGESQTAYQIIVSETLNELEKNTGIWNTGKVNSSNSVMISYTGQVLKSRQRYYWKVRIWDESGKESAWSKYATWEMGLLRNSDWSADWISAPVLFDFLKEDAIRRKTELNAPYMDNSPAPLFRKDFKVRSAVSARVYITGLGLYELYLNGKKVSTNVLEPAFTDYSKTVLYTTYDVSEFLKNGENTIGVMLANGWYNMTSRALWSFDKARWKALPVLRCQLEINYTDGTSSNINSDETWKCNPGPITFNSIQQGESYDANQEQTGWNSPGFKDDNWQRAEKVRGPEGMVMASLIPPVKVMKILNPVKIKKIKDSVFVVDFGQNISGFEQLTVRGRKHDKITLKTGEKLDELGLVDQRNINFQVRNERFQIDEFTLSGKGLETWSPKFNYNGFRYVEVRGFPGELTGENIKALVTYTSFKEAGSFRCSNDLINKINEAVRWSYTNNFVGYPTDCPHREKNGWTGDAQLMIEAGLFNYQAQNAYKKWIIDMKDAQLEDGMFPSIVPTAGWGYTWGNGPAWDHAFITIPWNLYVYNNDKELLVYTYPYLKKYLQLLRYKSEKHLVNWGLGDWATAKTKTPEALTSTAYYYEDVRIASRIAKLLGKKEDAEYYGKLADSIKTAFNTAFYDSKTSTYGNNSQTSLACPLFMKLSSKNNEAVLLENLVKAIKTNPLNLDFGILGSKFVINALADRGLPEVAYSMINSVKYPGWGNIISRGGTTLWSTWDGNSSLNHVMFGDVSAWFYKNLVGIRPDEDNPGFKHFYLQPFFPKEMTWVKADFNTLYGAIKVSWIRKSNKVVYAVDVPANTSATLYLPVKGAEHVKDNGHPISRTDVSVIKPGSVKVSLTSGKHAITFNPNK